MADKDFFDTTPDGEDGLSQYRDPTHIPNQNEIKKDIDTGDEDPKANTLSGWIRTKQWGVDVREALGLFVDWISVKFNALAADFKTVQKRQDDTEKRTSDVEQRQTTTEANVTATLKDMTDKAAKTGEGYGPEVVDARHSDIYGKDYNTVGEHVRAIEAAIAPYVANTSTTATIPVNLGRQVPISVSCYEYAIGTEPDGLGTGPYGLGGSEPQDVPYIAVTWTDSNTAQVALPVTYKDVVATGTLKAMANGSSWTLTAGYKTLRFVADA